MKGLLIKDFYLLANQKQMIFLLPIMFLLFAFVMDNPIFMINYLTIFIGLFSMSTISYDEFDNGYPYLFSLPVDAGIYVKEKYLFSTMLVVMVNLLSVGGTYLIGLINSSTYTASEILVTGGISILLALVFLSFGLSIQLKFGAEKGRLALLLVFLVLFAAVYLTVRFLLNEMQLSMTEFLGAVEEWSSALLVIGGIAIGIVFFTLSFFISLKIMGNKEF